MKHDAIVIGGGIIGALSAYELAKHGVKVQLLEKHAFGFGASGNSAAMLELQLDAYRGDPFLSLAKESHDLFPSLNEELTSQSGIDFHFQRCSILQVALNAEEASYLKQENDRQSRVGLRSEWLYATDIVQRVPGFTENQHGGILYSDDGQVNGGLFLEAALSAARKAGAVISEKVEKISLKECLAQAKAVIVAAGAWTDQVLKDIGVQLGVSPVRGQLIVYGTPTPVLPFPVYTKSGGYLTPKRDGTTLAGTTVESVGFNTEPTDEGRKHITSMVKALMPGLLDRPVLKMTAGLRPKSPDDLPIIGPLPDHPNVIIATGHYRNGVLLAPITAKLVSELVRGQRSSFPIDPFLPSRIYSQA